VVKENQSTIFRESYFRYRICRVYINARLGLKHKKL